MNKRLITSAKGITLVELLIALALFGMISVLVVSVLSGGMKSFKNINDDVSLHDEANAIMTSFANEIFVATSVSPHPDDSKNYIETNLIEIWRLEESGKEKVPVSIGFENKEARINGIPIHSSTLTVTEESYMRVFPETVFISLTVQGQNMKKLTLTSEVSFVKVDVD